jgi:two-component system response regulator YesN
MMFSILIVEDEPVVRIGLRALIESETKDFHVIGEVEDGEEALAFARRYAPDLIITDIRMPVMDGLALMESLRREGITAAVFVVSGYGEFEYAQQALRAGAADFLLKPVHADSLTKALDRLRDKLQMEKTIIVHDSKEQLWSLQPCLQVGAAHPVQPLFNPAADAQGHAANIGDVHQGI